MSKISVIIPVHNSEKYLESCLESVAQKNEKNIEIICVNDHSTDESESILKEYAFIYPKMIKRINLEEKEGVSSARNKGLEVAQGDWIYFLDSDDLLKENTLKDYLEAAKEYNVKIVTGKHQRFTSEEGFKPKESESKITLTDLEKNPQEIFNCCVASWNNLISHDLLENNVFLEDHIFEDVGFTYPILMKGKKIVTLPEHYYGYRKNNNGIMASRMKINEKILDILEVCLNGMQKENLNELQRKYLEDIFKKFLLNNAWCITNWQIDDAKKTYLIEEVLSIFNYYFPNIKRFASKEGLENAQSEIGGLRYYGYDDILLEKEAKERLEHTKEYIRKLAKKLH